MPSQPQVGARTMASASKAIEVANITVPARSGMRLACVSFVSLIRDQARNPASKPKGRLIVKTQRQSATETMSPPSAGPAAAATDAEAP